MMIVLKKCCGGFRKGIHLLGERSGDIAAIVVMAMVFLVVVDVSMRRFFNSPLSFSYELTNIMLVLVVLPSVFYVTGTDKHISINIVTSRLPHGVQVIITNATNFISVVLFGLIGWRPCIQGLHIRDIDSVTGMLHIPLYPFHFFVAFCSFLTSVAFLVKMIVRAKDKE